MADELATPASQIRFGILLMTTKRGALRLEDGFIAFTSWDGGLVFRALLQEVRASFPKVTFVVPFLFCGTAIKLAVGGNTYRLSFLRWGRDSPGHWSISVQSIRSARAAVRQWRAAFGHRTGLSSRWDVLVLVGALLFGLLLAVVILVIAAVIAALTGVSIGPGRR
jgi:hypothetical protein